MTISLLDSRDASQLPTPLARAALTLARETEANGVHTTADELSLCIEAFFGFIGRIWVAEYLAAGAPDPVANAELHGALVRGTRDPQTGHWIGLSRRLRDVFVARGLTPVAGDLLALDFGARGDDAHPVARLSAYRNSFAHGSFQSVVGDIHAHRALLEEVIGRLPFLVEQPILLDDGGTVLALRGRAEAASRPAAQLVPHHPTLVSEDGRTVDFYPLALGVDASGAHGLTWTSLDRKARDTGVVSPRNIAEHVAFSVWSDRYERELSGHIESARAPLAAPLEDADFASSVAQAVARLEATRGALLLVESPPGAPRAAALECALAALPVEPGAGPDERPDSTEALRWRVVPGDLTGSGVVFVKALARSAERLLGLADGTFGLADTAAWRKTLGDIARALSGAGRRLPLVIEDLHRGDAPARPGEPSVQEVYWALAAGPWRVVAGVDRAWSLRPLPWDARVTLDWRLGCDTAALARFLGERAATPLHARVLAALGADEAPTTAPGPLDLFTLCDRLEAGSNETLFEPAVERALWDLAPILVLDRVRSASEDGTPEDVRVFSLRDPAPVTAALHATPAIHLTEVSR